MPGSNPDPFAVTPAQAAPDDSGLVAGVDLVFAPYKLPLDQQETIMAQLQRAGVRYVRCSLPSGDAGADFAARLYAHGIRIVWMVGLTPAAGTLWPHAPQGFNGLWQGYTVCAIDPDKFRSRFRADACQNRPNGHSPRGPGAGQRDQLGRTTPISRPARAGLSSACGSPKRRGRAKGRQGHLQYLKLVAVLKQLRDGTTVNRNTPIISAGLAYLDDSTWTRKRRADAVDIFATLDFMRAHGLDQLVDGYGLHAYPRTDQPGTPAGVDKRRAHLEHNGLAECQPAGGTRGKPCWLTEWGAGAVKGDCPGDDTERVKLVRELRGTYGSLAQQGRIKGLIFYVWHGSWNATKEAAGAAFRCGSLTESGRLAVAP